MIQLLLDTAYFMLPAYMANMAPVIFQWIPWGGEPIDGGRSWRGHRILGDHKTYRGFIVGILMGMATAALQHKLGWLAPTAHFTLGKSLLFGALFGFGALAGDSLKSFLKRRVSIKSGDAWPPFDQLDFVIGGIAMVSPLYIPPLSIVVTALLLTPLLHFLCNLAAFGVGLKKVWW